MYRKLKEVICFLFGHKWYLVWGMNGLDGLPGRRICSVCKKEK